MSKQQPSLPSEGFFSDPAPTSPEVVPRKIYEFLGNENDTPFIRGYRQNLRSLQEEYIVAGRHLVQQELSEREPLVLQYGALGYTSAETGWAMYISRSTVTKDVKRIDNNYGTDSSLERVLTGTVLGDIDLAPAVDPEVIRRLRNAQFSPREWDVMRTLTEDLGRWSLATQLAERLGVSDRTVDSHLQHIMNKLGVNKKLTIGIHAFVALVSTGDYTLVNNEQGSDDKEQSHHHTVVFDLFSHTSRQGV